MSRGRFFALNMIGAVVWAVALGGFGFLFGEAFRLFLDDVKHYELWLLGGLVVAGLAVWLYTLLRHRRRARLHRYRTGAIPVVPTDAKIDREP